MVATWSTRPAAENGTPVSGSRAVDSRSNRSRWRRVRRLVPPLGDNAADQLDPAPPHPTPHRSRGLGIASGNKKSSMVGRPDACGVAGDQIAQLWPMPLHRQGKHRRAGDLQGKRLHRREQVDRVSIARPRAGRRAASAALATWRASSGMLRGAKAGATVRRWCFQSSPSLSNRPLPSSGRRMRIVARVRP